MVPEVTGLVVLGLLVVEEIEFVPGLLDPVPVFVFEFTLPLFEETLLLFVDEEETVEVGESSAEMFELES